VHQACRLSHDVVICFSPQDTYHASISSTPILTKCRSFHTFVSSINPPHRLEEALQCHSPLGPSHGELEQHYVSTLSIYDHIVLDTTSISFRHASKSCLFVSVPLLSTLLRAQGLRKEWGTTTEIRNRMIILPCYPIPSTYTVPYSTTVPGLLLDKLSTSKAVAAS
jgi:hypothetical protein